MPKPDTTDELDVDAADAQIKQKQSDVDYDTKDFTIDYIIKAFQDDLFYIPEYQRKFVWDPPRQRPTPRTMSSLLLAFEERTLELSAYFKFIELIERDSASLSLPGKRTWKLRKVDEKILRILEAN